jgi:endonuclease/exonuclease/phosphatase family metal-dependent hydrolase
MRILTWNLWGRSGAWRQRAEAIAATLTDVRPDVCGLQEVWGTHGQNLAAELADRLGMHWFWAQASEATDAATSIGNAVLSRWPVVEHAVLRLPTGDRVERRVAVHARLDAPGGVLPMFTTHLTYLPGGSAIRVGQVRQLAGFVAEHRVDGAYPPVLTGDLNAEPDSEEVRLLGGLHTAPAAPGLVLVDAWRYADPGDPGYTWDRRNGYQAESILPDCRIDYVLTGLPDGRRGRVRSSRLAGTSAVDGVWPSDHFAVVADLEP